MFGYVLPNKMELKVKEYELFKAYYCGVCKSIKKHFGQLPRMTLSYDMTFLAILLDSIEDERTSVQSERCFVHPNKKKPYVLDNKALSYAAFCNVALTYFKLVDDKEDDKSITSSFLSFILKGYFKKFPKDSDKILLEVEKSLKDLSKLEKGGVAQSIDEISHPFAHLVGYLISVYNSNDENLYNLGYNLGKWIYLIDAIDDLEKDMKKNKFNPLNDILNKENLPYQEFRSSILERIEFNLTTCGRIAFNELNNINLKKNEEIIKNILSLGLMMKMDKILNINNCKECGTIGKESI